MISLSSLAQIGKVNKTHGVNGELSISIYDAEIDSVLEPGLCLIFDLDGIFTPFFVSSVRPRSNEAWLIAFDGVNSQEDVSFLVGKDVYLSKNDMPDIPDDEEEGCYASDFIGYQANTTDGKNVGIIEDIDDSTANALFIIRTDDDQIVYIPITEEFISEISDTNKIIIFDLPAGLLSI